jgi:hypothetical protein
VWDADELSDWSRTDLTTDIPSGANGPPSFGIIRRDDAPAYPGASPSPSPTPAAPGPSTLGGQNCCGKDDFGSHSDIHGDTQRKLANFVCTNNIIFVPGTPSTKWNPHGVSSVDPYHYPISWIDGCSTSASSQGSSNPLASDSSVNCVQLLTDYYNNCKLSFQALNVSETQC